jgi:hypothetical protein
VLKTNSALPPKPRPLLTKSVVLDTVFAIHDRVVGGMMSFSAKNRSARVSSMGRSSSSSEEISESREKSEVSDDEVWGVGGQEGAPVSVK